MNKRKELIKISISAALTTAIVVPFVLWPEYAFPLLYLAGLCFIAFIFIGLIYYGLRSILDSLIK